MKKKILYIMCAAPGSGKSTWIKNHFSTLPGSVGVSSRDAIRFALVDENEEYFSKEKEVFKTYVMEIKNYLRTRNITIADATHLNEASRTKLLRALGNSLEGVEVNAIYIKIPVETAIKQNENRLGTRSYVPETVIRRMYSQLTLPSFEEGFDKIYIYRPEKENGYRYTILERSK